METRVLYTLFIAVFDKVDIYTSYQENKEHYQYKQRDCRVDMQHATKEKTAWDTYDSGKHGNDRHADNRIKALDGLFNLVHVS